jgi:hypothetical protein
MKASPTRYSGPSWSTPPVQAAPFAQEFDGMMIEHVPLGTLLDARQRLIGDIGALTVGAAAEFLLSVHDAEPDFELIGLRGALELPAIRWKLLNLGKLRDSDPEKRRAAPDSFTPVANDPERRLQSPMRGCRPGRNGSGRADGAGASIDAAQRLLRAFPKSGRRMFPLSRSSSR